MRVTQLRRVVDVVDHEDRDQVDACNERQQDVQELPPFVELLVVAVLPQEEGLHYQYREEDGGGRRGDAGLLREAAEEVRVGCGGGDDCAVPEPAEVPLDEVAVYLEGEEVEHEMRDVGVQQGAEEHAPQLHLVAQAREVLGLQAVERAVPAEVGLRARVVKDEQHEEHEGVGQREEEGGRAPGPAREEDAEQAGAALRDELVGLDQSVVLQLHHCLLVRPAHLALRAALPLLRLGLVVEGRLLSLVVLALRTRLGLGPARLLPPRLLGRAQPRLLLLFGADWHDDGALDVVVVRVLVGKVVHQIQCSSQHNKAGWLIVIIKLMSQIADQQEATRQFQRLFENSEKMQLLQGPVFKSYTVKKSVSVIHPKSHSPHRDAEKDRPKKEQFFVPLVNSERKKQEGPAVTTISFGPLRESWSQSARTLSQFTPRVTVHLSNCSVQREEKLLERMKRLELHDLKKNYESRPKLSEMRDSQTLLRKNTLFLVNCLKTRYRERKNAHIGERPEAANHMNLGNFSEKTAANTQYQQRFEYMEEAKQRLLQAKTERHVEGSRLSRLSPLLPEPWETERTMH